MAEITIDSVGASADIEWGGGIGNMQLRGDLGGSNLRPEFSTDEGVTWSAFGKSSGETLVLNRVASVNFELPPCDIRIFAEGGDPDATAEVLAV